MAAHSFCFFVPSRFKRFLNGSTLTLSLAIAGYVFAKLVEVGESEQHKKQALFAFNALWGCTIGHFVHGYLP